MKPYNNEKQYDINMMFVLFIFAVVSCFYVYLAQQQEQYETNFVIMQIAFYVISFAVAFAIMHFDFEYYLNLHWFLYGFGLFMLIALAIAPESLAPETEGATRWFNLGPINLQPSEFMKVFIIISLSAVIYQHNNMYTPKEFRSDIWLLAKMGGIIVPPIILLYDQPDMGMVMMMIAIAVGLTLISGISYKLLAFLYGIPALLFGAFIVLYFRFPEVLQRLLFDHMADYQVNRFHGWLQPLENPDDGFQVAQAMTAIGSGGLTGSSEHNVYFPEAHTDLIFAVVGMETGFIGTALVITLYFILFYQIMMTAIRCHHSFGTYMSAGVIALFTFQVFQNIGMNLGLLPVTGFTLPLMSYGGSSLLSSLLAIGIVLGVYYHSKSYFFEEE
ncbi:FtsW/RodA/SpoVE family cell cycle protein [Natribacillus halophilus]|uniref:Rod shape determining protein RodA n=1 Tax=Natribacillus halophilus TaxID=549003 RepID=A0A1G8LR14_9BACI|nr:FtsW/RodA/SpoVE family cell cycle protein [Natribacillus halophilus]SDI57917.1 rod shape determining protein RodA [Natribacillus halophilus]